MRILPALRTSSLAALVLLAGCNDDGRVLRAPIAGAAAPATTPTTSPTDPAVVGDTGTMIVTSSAFADRDPIPAKFTCDGAALSPPLAWTGLPAGTVEMAITVADPDANGFVHWIVGGLAPGLTGLPQGALPAGLVQTRNSASSVGWTPPCPPAGAKAHRYVFTLYALDGPPGVNEGADPRAALTLLDEHVIGLASMVGTYRRP